MTFLEKMTDEELLHIKKLGYFLGSFDPMHLGHIEVIRIILEKELCDAVFVYCVQGKSSWKQRSDFFQRTKYCESMLCNISNVILSYFPPQKVQQKLTIKEGNKVNRKFSHITGIIGADIACNLEYKNNNPAIEALRRARQSDFMQGILLDEKFDDSIACSIALPATDFIIALRKDYKIEDIPSTVCKRKVNTIIDTKEYRYLSSSEIKRCAENLNKL